MRRSPCAPTKVASYWSLTVGGRTWTDAVWTYGKPLPEALATDGFVSFLADGIVTEVS
ncbi:MAG: DUF427 domain-containing protein [Acidimicrobiales bacterium]